MIAAGIGRARLMTVSSGGRCLGLVSREGLDGALSILMFTARCEAA